jgi:hypothetical protein
LVYIRPSNIFWGGLRESEAGKDHSSAAKFPGALLVLAVEPATIIQIGACPGDFTQEAYELKLGRGDVKLPIKNEGKH